jgi:uncharacterized protein YyaL (SSP411 family)
MRLKHLCLLVLLTLPAVAASPAPPRQNHLAGEKSLYLQQHVNNPVDWYPWGEAAFARAKAEDKPIFLSIGYSTCHWCHVMERETFTDPKAAAVLNQNFISIKVDREEHPEVDQIYMAALQATGEGGGWPLNMLLTPQREPFFGASYIPPARDGKPGFIDLMTQMASIWKKNRKELLERAKEITQAVRESTQTLAGGTVDRSILFRYLQDTSGLYDPVLGGFSLAPKFPAAMPVQLLLTIWYQIADQSALEMATHTLKAMAAGGMYDQLGGGFHRYSTDVRWLVPHFEKMLYDNALLAEAYLDGYGATNEKDFARVARETLDYLLRDMHDPAGGFYSATDADSEGEEGRFFVWTPAQLKAIIPTEAKAFTAVYGVTDKGNFEKGQSILHVVQTPEKAAAGLKMTPAAVEAAIARARPLLLAAREKRVHPARDEKIITAWNALAIQAFARGYEMLGDERYRTAALQAGEFIFSHLVENGNVYRRYAGGGREHPGGLEDYAQLADACIDLYEITFDPVWLQRSKELLDGLEAFADKAGGYYSAKPRVDLITNTKEAFDGVIPSGNAAAVVAMARFYQLTGNDEWKTRAQRVLDAFSGSLSRHPSSHPWMILGLNRLLGSNVEVVLAGDPQAPDLIALQKAAYAAYCPTRVLALAGGPHADAAGKLLSILAERTPIGGAAAAYVCRGRTCRRPTTKVSEMLEDLAPVARRMKK